MASVVVTLKIMPESPDTSLSEIENKAKKEIKAFVGETETKTSEEPIAFGLKALKIMFVMNESKGTTEPLEKKLADIKGVNSVDVIDVRRAVG